jgi:GTP pyrophosphokinase
LPGDDVLGFVTRGRGITIHRRDCANVRQSSEPERWVEIGWGRDRSEAHGVDIEVVAQSSSGLLNRVVKLLTHLGVAVTAAKIVPNRDERVRLLLTLEARDSEQLAFAMQRMSTQPDVEDVRMVVH